MAFESPFWLFWAVLGAFRGYLGAFGLDSPYEKPFGIVVSQGVKWGEQSKVVAPNPNGVRTRFLGPFLVGRGFQAGP